MRQLRYFKLEAAQNGQLVRGEAARLPAFDRLGGRAIELSLKERRGIEWNPPGQFG